MRPNILAWTALVAASSMLLISHANAEKFHAVLSGFEEVGPLGANEIGAIFSRHGKGTIDLDLNEKLKAINYTLTYSGLSAPITQAHIHFGKRHMPGGVIVFFCTNLGNGPAETPACPAGAAGTVTGTWTPASVVLNGQGVTPGDFDALVAALESDTAYGNVHTQHWPAGEIRGQIREPDHDKH